MHQLRGADAESVGVILAQLSLELLNISEPSLPLSGALAAHRLGLGKHSLLSFLIQQKPLLQHFFFERH